MKRRTETARLIDIVRRQDEAIDIALDAFARLAKTGSLHKEVREHAAETLKLARNERMLIDSVPLRRLTMLGD